MKINQTTAIALLAAGALLAFQPVASAQDKSTNSPAKTEVRPPGGRPGYSPEERMARMTEALSLTDDQKPKVKALIDEQSKEFAGFRDLSQDERRAKMRAAREEMGKKLKNILTDEQFKKWEAIPQRGGQRPQGGSEPKPDAPKADAPKS